MAQSDERVTESTLVVYFLCNQLYYHDIISNGGLWVRCCCLHPIKVAEEEHEEGFFYEMRLLAACE